jgi:hypothetical protein
MWRRVGLVRNDVSEEERGSALAVVSLLLTLPTANAVPLSRTFLL